MLKELRLIQISIERFLNTSCTSSKVSNVLSVSFIEIVCTTG